MKYNKEIMNLQNQYQQQAAEVVIRFQVCIFDILNTAQIP